MYYIARTSYTFLPCFITLPFLLRFFISNVFSTCIYTYHSTGANAPSLVLGQCTIVVWTAPTRTYGRIIGYDVNFVLLGSEEDVMISKGSRELFHVIGDEIASSNELSTLVQVLYTNAVVDDIL